MTFYRYNIDCLILSCPIVSCVALCYIVSISDLSVIFVVRVFTVETQLRTRYSEMSATWYKDTVSRRRGAERTAMLDTNLVKCNKVSNFQGIINLYIELPSCANRTRNLFQKPNKVLYQKHSSSHLSLEMLLLKISERKVWDEGEGES